MTGSVRLSNIRMKVHKLWLLVMIGVCADDNKELIALADGCRKSAEPFAETAHVLAALPKSAHRRAKKELSERFEGADLGTVFVDGAGDGAIAQDGEGMHGRLWQHPRAGAFGGLPRVRRGDISKDQMTAFTWGGRWRPASGHGGRGSLKT